MKHSYMIVAFRRNGQVTEDRYYKLEYACEHFREWMADHSIIDMQLVNIEHPSEDKVLREYSRHD